jgi:superfamily II DNA/RNA helicase
MNREPEEKANGKRAAYISFLISTDGSKTSLALHMQQKNGWLPEVMRKLKITALNEMQVAATEAYLKDQDIVLLSATGSGKTLAYLLPIIPLLQNAGGTTRALVIVPSRELAQQIETVFKSMGLSIKASACYGGHKRETEENNLKQAPALLIGTPGRLADHIRRGTINTSTIETLVLDEFDKSLEMGFDEEMSFIISKLPAIQKRILTSATHAVAIPPFAGLVRPVTLNFINDSSTQNNQLAVKIVPCSEKDKINNLFRLICLLGNRSTIIFCNHRESVERTSQLLKEKDILNVFYHGAMEQQDRDAALCKFRNGTSNILVTTDLAARGLDMAHIRYIIHYHLPATEDIFTHRNGRTARMGASGTAILMLGPEETLPSYILADAETIVLPDNPVVPDKPVWSTLFIAAGKKDKVNKIDIVGFLGNKGKLKKEDIGLIEVKDFFSFVAVRKSKVSTTLQLIKDEKIKNKKVKIAVAK